MFGSKNNTDKEKIMANNNQSQNLDTLIGQNTNIKGDISFTGLMHLDGSVEGSISATTENDTVIISETGRISGTVKSGNLIINGLVEGDITASGKIEVASKARVNGNIYYVNIEMEAGSQVNGKLIYQGGEVTPMISKKSEKDGQ
ncbi:MAG: bactofilin family protein [Marinicella sp.]